MQERKPPLDYAPAQNKSKAGDFVRLMIIGTVFGILYAAVLFWWVLFR